MSVTLVWYSECESLKRTRSVYEEGIIMIAINKTKYAEIARKMRELPLEKHGSSHEWEELVQKLCNSGDEGLRGIGIREFNELKKSHTAIRV